MAALHYVDEIKFRLDSRYGDATRDTQRHNMRMPHSTNSHRIASNYCQREPVNGMEAHLGTYDNMPYDHTMGCFIALSPDDIVVASDQCAQ